MASKTSRPSMAARRPPRPEVVRVGRGAASMRPRSNPAIRGRWRSRAVPPGVGLRLPPLVPRCGRGALGRTRSSGVVAPLLPCFLRAARPSMGAPPGPCVGGRGKVYSVSQAFPRPSLASSLWPRSPSPVPAAVRGRFPAARAKSAARVPPPPVHVGRASSKGRPASPAVLRSRKPLKIPRWITPV